MLAAVAALAKTLALELAPVNIQVNQIIPGRIGTDRVRTIDELSGEQYQVSVEERAATHASTQPSAAGSGRPAVRRAAGSTLRLRRRDAGAPAAGGPIPSRNSNRISGTAA